MKIKLHRSRLLLLILVILFAVAGKGQIAAPLDLTISEGFKNPIGFYTSMPTFSWKLPFALNVKSQSAYRIVAATESNILPYEADLWDSKRVNSDQSVWVKYNGIPLKSRQGVYWKVMFWDQDGNPSDWSEVAYFELGLLGNNDWQAEWISLTPGEVNENTIYIPQYLRRNFSVRDSVKQARLYITSKGVFEAQINGQKVGQDAMTPGWTPYKKRIETLTYDVSERIAKGENAIGVIVGQGWYWGRINHFNKKWSKKPYPAVICQLEITYVNGEKKTIVSNSEWKGSSNGPIQFSGIYDGEFYDAELEMPGWSAPGFNDELWKEVEHSKLESNIQLVPKRHNTVKDKDELFVKTITEPEPGKFVFDLGQNMIGIPEINIPVKANQKVTIRFAEMLQEDGNLYTENYRTALSTDFYIPKENGVVNWRPAFTFHGFRYIELSGFDENKTPDKNWVKGIVQYSDFDKIGSFNSSHKKLNQLHSNINWGLRGNFFDVPTDCPQRDERMGWTGDAQVFAPTSILNCDVYSFWASWLQSMREEQFEDGSIPIVIPSNRSYASSAGWSDAATVIPWEIYWRTGDQSVLEENYKMMKMLVEYYQLVASSPDKQLKPLGDWLQPYSQNKVDDKQGETPIDFIEMAYFAYSIRLTIQAAEVLGYHSDVLELKKLYGSVQKDFENNFFEENGKLTTDFETQTGYLMALGFDLVSEKMAQNMVPHLVRKIKDADNHLRTGFLGTPLLAPVLHKYGQSDLMYTILLKETYPSWFYSINQGATTIWERWNSYSHKNGFGDAGMNSFNHYAYGAIGQWMYEGIAGIKALAPGYKKILIAPVPGEQLEFANAEYNSVYGKIVSGWKKEDGGLLLNVTIPPNTTGKVIVPIKEGMNILIDGKNPDDFKNVNFKRNRTNIVFEIVAGTYNFKTIAN